ncbi:MAG: LysR family transcriptional regulator [Actinobacteria bacterium]|nr:LysR family transcriptional regulator [Actinomycetota bacterium]
MLNVQRLRVFKEVVTQGSFSRAADSLDYTQSAVSQAIATLEAEVGATLIDRDRRGLRLTAVGEALVGHADAILGRLGAAEEDVAAIIGLRGGRLRLASFPTAGATLMPRAIARFREDYPQIELSLAEGEPEEIVPRLRAGELDLALLFDFPGDGAGSLTEGLATTELFEDPMYVALPEGHRLAAKASLTLEDLRNEAWVQTSAPSPCARHVVRCCHRAGFEPIVSFESDDYQTVQGLVGAGVGVALIPELALSVPRDGIAIRTLSPSPPARRVVVATSPSPRGTPAAAEMRAILLEGTDVTPVTLSP